MQNVSAAFLAAMENAPYIARLTLDGKDTIKGNAIPKFSSHGGSSGSNEAIMLGGTVAGSVTITLDKEQIDCALEKRKLLLELGIDLGASIEWLPMGSYTVTDVSEDDDSLILTAGDALSSKFDVEFTPIEGFDFEAEEGVDSLAFLAALCSRRGVEVETSGLTGIPLKTSPEGYTERQIIGFISALHGGFANIDRSGILKIKWYTESDITVDADIYYAGGMEKASFNFTVGWLKCYVEPMAETLTLGDTTADQGIYFECPWMDEERLAEIWEQVQGFTYRPVPSLKHFGDPRVDPGDIITLEDLGGAMHIVPIMQVNHEYDGGIITQIASHGQAKTDYYEGPVKRENRRLYSRIVKKQNEIELSIKEFDGDKIISLINLSETEALIQAPKIKFEGMVTANENFRILEDGSIEATNAVISGSITAETGKVGSWEILASGILGSAYKGSDGLYYGIALDANSTSFAKNSRVFAIGQLGAASAASGNEAIDGTWKNAAFYVTADGSVTATNANITGTIKSISGNSAMKIDSASFTLDFGNVHTVVLENVVGTNSTYSNFELCSFTGTTKTGYTQITPSGIILGGGNDPGQIMFGVDSKGGPYLSIQRDSGEGIGTWAISWKDNGDGTYTLIGKPGSWSDM